jgi:hypothetical protein
MAECLKINKKQKDLGLAPHLENLKKVIKLRPIAAQWLSVRK